MQSHDAVRQFMKKDGTKKQKAGEDAFRPVLSQRPLGVHSGKYDFGELIGSQAKNEQPTGIQINGNA